MNKVKCQQCKHEWIPRVDKPLECPDCKRKDWNAQNMKGERRQAKELADSSI